MAKKKVLEVQDVKLSILRIFPPQLNITAHGTVTTGGWKGAELIPYIYIQPPADGIYDYDFVAEPPEGIASQAIASIEANFRLESIPGNLKGVRIYASTNNKIALLDQSSSGKVAKGVEC